VKAAVDGVYNDKFFGSAKTDQGYHKRLRGVVQNTLTRFEEDMRSRGHAYTIVEKEPGGGSPKHKHNSRDEYIDEVKDLMRRNRGCELPGTFNPLIVGGLFAEQCQPWQQIIHELKDEVLRAVYRTTQAILGYIAVDETMASLLGIINKGIEDLKADVNSKV